MASEKMHWYYPDGRTAYTQVVKSGKNKGFTRNTTLADARKLGLLPSVTTILNILDKPGLTNWRLEQVMLASLTLPREHEEAEKDYIRRVMADSREQGKKAAEEGTRIHGVIEGYFLGRTPDIEEAKIVDNVLACLPDNQYWKPEKSCVHELGYAGKVDLHSDEWVIDFKTTEKENPKCWPEHYLQLAAYKNALGIEGRCGNIFIDRNTYECTFIQHSKEETEKAWEQFKAILLTWKLLRGYDASNF